MFHAVPVISTDVLMEYTYVGDANLDGLVNGNDYSLTDTGFNMRRSGWFNGDFNYDGLINADDYTLIDRGFERSPATERRWRRRRRQCSTCRPRARGIMPRLCGFFKHFDCSMSATKDVAFSIRHGRAGTLEL